MGTRRRGLVLVLCALGAGCARVDGVVAVFNGPTPAVPEQRMRAAGEPLQDGTYALSPARMTLTVTGVAFFREGQDPDSAPFVDVADCAATYDRSLSSLALLESCDVALPVGTFAGLQLGFVPEFEMIVADEVAGIWSDPDAPGLLTTIAPVNGVSPILVRDQNNDDNDTQVGVYFDAPLTIAEGDAPEVFVLFDPTHWFKANLASGVFSEPFAAGNPPVLPAIDGFAKSTWYSNLPTDMSYNWGGCGFESCMSLLFLYRDAQTPVTVTWQDHDICRSPTGNNPVVAFDSDGARFGTFGMLGLDAAGTLAWASAWHTDNEAAMAGYTGVYRMPEGAVPGDVVDLAYRCTSEVPPPVEGHNYASGAPEFTPDGILPLTLKY